ncbi:uncharacterized protein N7473_002822 [Penicillium subrubescens]|uniref:uncharacterized protein n=1 Tax=Penicillium subrubescens TaxID=1316194 RepID=UPI0025454E13|nr:uncharacterized protein N7473_002822 [Penicillium subrubescens]KAJ5905906.1 hypothetical protein N7473_002822 [Penicillium subrubescens]
MAEYRGFHDPLETLSGTWAKQSVERSDIQNLLSANADPDMEAHMTDLQISLVKAELEMFQISLFGGELQMFDSTNFWEVIAREFSFQGGSAETPHGVHYNLLGISIMR